jgi:hypothetical protein
MSANTVDWPQIGDIAEGHSGYRPDPTADLAGKSLRIHFAGDGPDYRVVFESPDQLRWYQAGSAGDVAEHYEAFLFAPDLYFVDFIRSEQPDRSITLILDLGEHRVLQVTGTLPDRELARMDELTRLERGLGLSVVRVEYRHGVIESDGEGGNMEEYPRTDHLTGKRCRFIYSDTHVYDHIYVNDKYYMWYCHAGPDQGLGDFDHCDYFQIAPDIYLIVWRERLSPCIAVMLEDHANMRSLGKIFGLDVNTGDMQNFTAGSYMQLLDETTWEPGSFVRSEQNGKESKK